LPDVSRSFSVFALFALCCAVTLGGCGPVSYLGAVRREASRAVAEAGAAGAAERAPYEWTAALIFLDRARDLAGHSRWQESLACGRRATDFARAASKRAQQREQKTE